ncbi:hypothetical protein HY251_02985 [bacterium]|nr:hypothetical protein [bacterium]
MIGRLRRTLGVVLLSVSIALGSGAVRADDLEGEDANGNATSGLITSAGWDPIHCTPTNDVVEWDLSLDIAVPDAPQPEAMVPRVM